MTSEKEREVLRGAIQFLYRHIRFDDLALAKMSGNDVFDLFDERRYHPGLRGRVDQVFLDSVYETSEVHIATFIMSILEEGLFSVNSLVVAIIFLSRFKEVTKVLVHTFSWRLLLLVALLVADKSHEDKPIRNKAMSELFPVISAKELNELELLFCLKIRFTFVVRAELFSSFVRDKLLTERISREMNDAIELFIKRPALTTATPQTIVKRGSKVSPTYSAPRTRSRQPERFKTNMMDSSTASDIKRTTPTMRSASMSRALSISSFLADSPPTIPRGAETYKQNTKPIRGFAVQRLCREPRELSYFDSPSFNQRATPSTRRGFSPTPPRWNMY
jgi:hypothetical protein